MPVNREHAFGEGPAYPAPAEIRRWIWASGFLGNNLRRAAQIWRCFQNGAILESDCLLGLNAWCHNRSGDPARIFMGSGAVCRGLLRVENFGAGTIRIGQGSYVGDDCLLSAASGIEIGKGVLLAHGVQVFDNDSHPVDPDARRRDYEALRTGGPREPISAATIQIADHAWVGFGAVLLKGITVGAGAVVAAGSVVVHDVPAATVVAGNPARVVKTI